MLDHPAMNPAAPRHLPSFIAGPGQSDWLMTVMAMFLPVAVVGIGLVYLTLHALPVQALLPPVRTLAFSGGR